MKTKTATTTQGPRIAIKSYKGKNHKTKVRWKKGIEDKTWENGAS